MNKEMNGIRVYLIINHISVIATKVIYKFQPFFCNTFIFYFLFFEILDRMTFFAVVKNHVQR